MFYIPTQPARRIETTSSALKLLMQELLNRWCLNTVYPNQVAFKTSIFIPNFLELKTRVILLFPLFSAPREIIYGWLLAQKTPGGRRGTGTAPLNGVKVRDIALTGLSGTSDCTSGCDVTSHRATVEQSLGSPGIFGFWVRTFLVVPTRISGVSRLESWK